MRRYISYILYSLLFLTSTAACGTKTIVQRGTVIGRVFNEDRSMGIAKAHVVINTLDNNTFTDEDGWYCFTEIPVGKYTIIVTKEGYVQDTGQVSVQSQNLTLYDIVLHSALAIRDALGRTVSVLDFGESLSSLSFAVCNMSDDVMQCYTKSDVPWVSVSAIQTPIPPGGGQEIDVSIARSMLNGGTNTGNLSIIAGSLKTVISITAIGETIKPIVQTLPMSSYYGSQSGWVDTFNGKVLHEGKPSYKQKGFCFSPTNTEPTVKDIIVGVTGNNGARDFSFYAFEFFANHPYRETYYARAWIMSGENQYEYGDVIEFVFNPSNLTF